MVMVDPRRTGRALHSFIYSCSHSLIQKTLLMHLLYVKGSARPTDVKRRGLPFLWECTVGVLGVEEVTKGRECEKGELWAKNQTGAPPCPSQGLSCE